MLPLLSSFLVAQVTPATTPVSASALPRGYIAQPQEVRALPGKLNEVFVFNSNSPEVVKTEGILLSTFPPLGKAFPSAHLNLPFTQRFDLFSHHIARPDDGRTLYQGVIVYNPNSEPVTLDILQAASYLTSTDAPFIDLPPYLENPYGRIYSGPGSRLTLDILRGVHQSTFPSQISILPKQSHMLLNLPISTGSCRSTYMRLRSNLPVYMANLAMGSSPSRSPSLAEWQGILKTKNIIGPRDRSPTPPEQIAANIRKIFYGRVAGVVKGSEWQAQIVDAPGGASLLIPQPGKAFSYPLSTVTLGTLATGQVQSAPMVVRYPDTAYLAHGNYGVRYNLTLPLVNNTKETQTITLAIQTPLKHEGEKNILWFYEPPGRVFFRGTVQVSYRDDRGIRQIRYIHLVQRQGEQGQPLVTLNIPPGDRHRVDVDFLYPPDATPPQALTVRTLEPLTQISAAKAVSSKSKP